MKTVETRRPRRSIALFGFYAFISHCNAIKIFDANTIPNSITPACSRELLKDVDCSPTVKMLRNDEYYQQKTLERTCKPGCSNSLEAYNKNVISACGSQTLNKIGKDDPEQIATITDLLMYQYSLTCLMDTGKYCNLVAAGNAAAIQLKVRTPAILDLPTIAPNVTDSCSMCSIKKLQIEAGSPYYYGPKLAAESVYQSKTASCKISNMPMSTSRPVVPDSPTGAPSKCAGTTYQVKAGDSCKSVAKRQGISTGWLIFDNNLSASCDDLTKSSSLCLKNTCKIHAVTAGETCESIAKANNINTLQLQSWNPFINYGCNLTRFVGESVCVGMPGKPYKLPSGPAQPPTSAVTPAPVPPNLAANTTSRCGKYFKTAQGQDCNTILMKFGISIQDFKYLNPSINENCTDMLRDTNYCVQAVGDINTYPGRGQDGIGKLQTAFTTGLMQMTWSKQTVKPTATSSTEHPLATGTRADCDRFVEGNIFQVDKLSNIWKSSCDFVMAAYELSLKDLQRWNPSLSHSTINNCSLSVNARYCVGLGERGPKPKSKSTLPIRPGAIKTCTEYISIPNNTLPLCQNLLRNNAITIAQFSDYNPGVGKECGNLWAGYRYCIRAPGYVAPREPDDEESDGTRTTAGPSATPAPNMPPATKLQPGIVLNCNKWAQAPAKTNCDSFARTNKISPENLYAWNSQLGPGGSKCDTMMWTDYYYCIGTSNAPKSSSQGPSSTTTSQKPSKTQADSIVPNCRKFDVVKEGDGCSSLAARNNIAPEKLYKWNKVLGAKGENCETQVWKGYFYCVGV
ncbi:LysM domain-containing protein [Tothia fuscella]|uniref:LysM domain-containing protein n=1 Tax=Tothia fuscella TaxID=1048955 RepID=A0A9P4NEE6_9PEZI|nr:LysM domain-containing protein [Tothia fuscella]